MKNCITLQALFLFIPGLSHACAVCFGQDPSSGATRGFYWGVVLLLVLPFLLMGTIAGLVFYHIRRNRRLGSPRP